MVRTDVSYDTYHFCRWCLQGATETEQLENIFLISYICIWKNWDSTRSRSSLRDTQAENDKWDGNFRSNWCAITNHNPACPFLGLSRSVCLQGCTISMWQMTVNCSWILSHLHTQGNSDSERTPCRWEWDMQQFPPLQSNLMIMWSGLPASSGLAFLTHLFVLLLKAAFFDKVAGPSALFNSQGIEK